MGPDGRLALVGWNQSGSITVSICSPDGGWTQLSGSFQGVGVVSWAEPVCFDGSSLLVHVYDGMSGMYSLHSASAAGAISLIPPQTSPIDVSLVHAGNPLVSNDAFVVQVGSGQYSAQQFTVSGPAQQLYPTTPPVEQGTLSGMFGSEVPGWGGTVFLREERYQGSALMKRYHRVFRSQGNTGFAAAWSGWHSAGPDFSCGSPLGVLAASEWSSDAAWLKVLMPADSTVANSAATVLIAEGPDDSWNAVPSAVTDSFAADGAWISSEVSGFVNPLGEWRQIPAIWRWEGQVRVPGGSGTNIPRWKSYSLDSRIGGYRPNGVFIDASSGIQSDGEGGLFVCGFDASGGRRAFRLRRVADTDGDGVSDLVEQREGTDPFRESEQHGSYDGDSDGLSVIEEFSAGTSTDKSDTDGDGMPDGWEVEEGLDPLNAADGAQDPDRDRVTNRQEFAAGTRPLGVMTPEYGVLTEGPVGSIVNIGGTGRTSWSDDGAVGGWMVASPGQASVPWHYDPALPEGSRLTIFSASPGQQVLCSGPAGSLLSFPPSKRMFVYLQRRGQSRLTVSTSGFSSLGREFISPLIDNGVLKFHFSGADVYGQALPIFLAAGPSGISQISSGGYAPALPPGSDGSWLSYDSGTRLLTWFSFNASPATGIRTGQQTRVPTALGSITPLAVLRDRTVLVSALQSGARYWLRIPVGAVGIPEAEIEPAEGLPAFLRDMNEGGDSVGWDSDGLFISRGGIRMPKSALSLPYGVMDVPIAINNRGAVVGHLFGADGQRRIYVMKPADDQDGDGVPDDWETYYLGGYWVYDGVTDPAGMENLADADGMTIGAEFAAGTDPFAGDSDMDGLRDSMDPAPTVPLPAAGADRPWIAEVLCHNQKNVRMQAAKPPWAKDSTKRPSLIELYNPSLTPISLQAWKLGWQSDSGGPNSQVTLSFDASLSLAPGERRVIFAWPKKSSSTQPLMVQADAETGEWTAPVEMVTKVNSDLLALPGRLILEKANGDDVQVMDLIGQRADVSFGLTDSGTSTGFLPRVTPGEPNGSVVFKGITPAVTFTEGREHSIAAQGTVDRPPVGLLSGGQALPGTEFVVTTDGSDPRDSLSAQRVAVAATGGDGWKAEFSLSGFGSRSVVLRVAAQREGFLPSLPVSSSHLVARTLPDREAIVGMATADRSGQPVDYGVDASTEETPGFPEATIPAVSLVLPMEEFFGSGVGLLANRLERGDKWVRSGSMEWIAGPNSEAQVLAPLTTVSCGIGIAGGASRISPKPGFRLRFDSDYGGGKWQGLVAAGFHGAPSGNSIDGIEGLELRPMTQDSYLLARWESNPKDQPTAAARATYMRDRFAAELCRARGLPAPGHQYVNLWLNGIYWGLYDAVERPDEQFFAKYFSGKGVPEVTDSNVIVVRDGEVDEGSAGYWRSLFDAADLVRQGRTQLVANAAGILQAAAPASDGPLITDLLDLDQFIRYMLVMSWLQAADWPERNWIAGAKQGEKFEFVQWDSDLALADRGSAMPDISSDAMLSRFASMRDGPGALFAKLMQSTAFRQRWDTLRMADPGPWKQNGEFASANWNSFGDKVEPLLQAEAWRWLRVSDPVAVANIRHGNARWSSVELKQRHIADEGYLSGLASIEPPRAAAVDGGDLVRIELADLSLTTTQAPNGVAQTEVTQTVIGSPDVWKLKSTPPGVYLVTVRLREGLPTEGTFEASGSVEFPAGIRGIERTAPGDVTEVEYETVKALEPLDVGKKFTIENLTKQGTQFLMAVTSEHKGRLVVAEGRISMLGAGDPQENPSAGGAGGGSSSPSDAYGYNPASAVVSGFDFRRTEHLMQTYTTRENGTGTTFQPNVLPIWQKGRDTLKFESDVETKKLSVHFTEAGGPTFRKIALSGLPLPDARPQTKPETDSDESDSYVDALTLQLRHDSTDFSAGLPGSDLVMKIQRSVIPEVSTNSSGYGPDAGTDSAKLGWRLQRPFGAGWQSGLGAHLRIDSVAGGGPSPSKGLTATVVDENGCQWSFAYMHVQSDGGGYAFIPLPGNRTELDQFENTLEVVDAGTGTNNLGYVFRRKYGTAIWFGRRAERWHPPIVTSYPISAGTPGGTGAQAMTSWFLPAMEVRDRFGGRLVYDHGAAASELVRMFPTKVTSVTSSNAQVAIFEIQPASADTADPRSRLVGTVTMKWKSADSAQVFDKSATTTYEYTDGAAGSGLLARVLRPGDTSGTRYTYSIFTEPDLSPSGLTTVPSRTFKHRMLESVSHQGNPAWRFDYQQDLGRLDRHAESGGPLISYTPPGLPRILARVTRPDGASADFMQDASDPVTLPETGTPAAPGAPTVAGLRRNYVRDCGGFVRRWDFSDPEAVDAREIETYLKPHGETSHYEMSQLVLWKEMQLRHPNGMTETYKFDPQAGMALKESVDASGNKTEYEHNEKRQYIEILTANSPQWVVLQGIISALYPNEKKSFFFRAFHSDPSAEVRIVPALKGREVPDARTEYRYKRVSTGSGTPGVRVLSDVLDVNAGHLIKYEFNETGGAATGLRELETHYSGVQAPTGDFGEIHGGVADLRKAYVYGQPVSGVTVPGWFLSKETVTDANAEVLKETSYTPDDFGYVRNTVTGIDAEAAITEEKRDSLGRVTVSSRGSEGAETQFEYDVQGRLVATTLPDAYPASSSPGLPADAHLQQAHGLGVIRSVYDERGRKVREIDARGFWTEWRHDMLGRRVLERRYMGVGKDPIVMSWHYDERGNLAGTEGPRPGQTTRFEYDELNRLRRTTDAAGHSTWQFYEDALVSLPLPGWYREMIIPGSKFLGNCGAGAFSSQSWKPVCVAGPTGTLSWAFYDALGRTIRAGTTVHEVGRPAGSDTLDLGFSETWYDGSGNPVASADSKGRATLVEYDNRSRPVKKASGVPISGLGASGPSPQAVAAWFAAAGNRHAITAFEYTADGQIKSEMLSWWLDRSPRTLIKKTLYDSAGRVRWSILPDASGQPMIGPDVDVLQARGSATTPYTGAPAANLAGTEFIYNSAGDKLREIVYWPDGPSGPTALVTTFAYDARNRLYATFHPAVPVCVAGTTTQSPPGSNLVVPVSRAVLDQSGNQIFSEDARGYQTFTTFDGAGRQVMVRGAGVPVYVPSSGSQTTAVPVTVTEYDAAGNPVRVTAPNGSVTVNEYDALNRLASTRRNPGAAAGQPASQDLVVRNAYDPLGQLVAVTDGLGQVTRYEYDALGRKVKEAYGANPSLSEPIKSGDITVFGYDRLDLVQKRWPDGSVSVYDYDDYGRLDQVRQFRSGSDEAGGTDPPEEVVEERRTYEYEGIGSDRIISVLIGPDGGDPIRSVTHSYDVPGRMLKEKSAGVTTGYQYDSVGHRIRTTSFLTSPQVGPETGGLTLRSTFDAGGRLASTSEYPSWSGSSQALPSAGRSSTYGYDIAGNLVLTTQTRGNGDSPPETTHRILDSAGRVAVEHVAGKRLARSFWDITGNLACQHEYQLTSVPAGTGNPGWHRRIVNGYDALSRLASEVISEFDTAVPTASTATFLSGTGTTGCRRVSSTSWRYDLADNRVARTETEERRAANSTSWVRTAVADQRCLYRNAAGTGPNGRNQLSQSWETRTRWDAESGAPLELSEQTVNYRYDPRGNRTRRTTRLWKQARTTGSAAWPVPTVTDTDEALEWDGENRLTGMWRGPWKEELAQVPYESLVGEAVAGSTVWRWGYDHRSRRVQRDEPGSGGERLRTVTVFSGGTSAAEYTAAAGSAWTVPLAPTVQHVRGPDLGGGTKGLLYSLRNGLPTFNRYNGRGDVVAQSDIDGTTTWAASYQADGRRTAEAGTNVERHRANTKEEDPTGLLNEGFRYRDMETGTFISRDPLGLVDGPNVYCYVRQNPWTMWDPEGLWGIGDSNGPVLDYLWDLGGGVVDGGIEAVEGMGHAVAHPINTATAVKDGVLAVRDGIGELSSALDAGHVTWGEIGTAYSDGLTEVASDPAKVGKIVGGSAVSLGVGKAAAVGGKLAMAAVVQTNTARTVAVSAVLATAELAPVASGAARGGAIAAQVGTGFANGAKQAAKTTGGAAPVRLGQAGEAAIENATGLTKNTTTYTVNGRGRIPDFVRQTDAAGNPISIIESKNVQYQSLTRQLRDNVDLVGPGGRVDVALPPGARVSRPLQRAFDDPDNPLFRMDLPQ